MIKLGSIPGFLKVLSELNRFKKKYKEIERLQASGDIEAEKALIQECIGVFSTNVSNKLGIKYEFIGEENIPEDGPVLIMMNHQGFCDILACMKLMSNHFEAGYVAKAEWKKLTPLADAIEHIRSIFLVRDDPREALKAVNDAKEIFDAGFSLVIYPEGTRSRKHEMGEFKPGAFKFAQKAGVPILPMTVDNSYKAYEEHGVFKPCTIRIIVHPLVDYGNMDRKQQKVAQKEIEDAIRSGLDYESEM